MGSSFKGVDLFGSGPHRFSLDRQGHLVISAFGGFGDFSPDTFPIGLVELEVVVTGRLVAASESALWTRRDAIVAQFEDSFEPTPGALVDQAGRSFADMVIFDYVEDDRVDRGRAWSVGYEARFRRFADLSGSRFSGSGSGSGGGGS